VSNRILKQRTLRDGVLMGRICKIDERAIIRSRTIEKRSNYNMWGLRTGKNLRISCMFSLGRYKGKGWNRDFGYLLDLDMT
jgi:hypothetical protein